MKVVNFIAAITIICSSSTKTHAFSSTRSFQARTTSLTGKSQLGQVDKRFKSTSALFSSSSAPEEGEKLDQFLSANNLKDATNLLKNLNNNNIEMSKERLIEIFRAIEVRTTEAEENDMNKRNAQDANISLGAMEYPPVSPARMEMTDMYRTLKSMTHLTAFGAASNGNYPVQGSKTVTPDVLEEITKLSVENLAPQPTNTLLLAGAALAVIEGIVSFSTGINLNFLIFATVFLGVMDSALVNGAIFETAIRLLRPEYSRKVLKHEAGHFLIAYLLGCPVEGCVLSTWAALSDARFGGRRTSVSAGTSFFDPDLSDEINGRRPLQRASIDRFSVIVMGGIAAEALEFGRADGGAGDEMALITFLSNLNPRGGRAQTWGAEAIKNQARWGALQAVCLLKEYRACYDALVDALERGGTLGECVYAIEKAAKEEGLPTVAEKPLGYINDELNRNGNPVSFSVEKKVKDKEETLQTPVSTPISKAPITDEDMGASLEDLKKQMEEKLKKIDSQLKDLES